MGSGSRQYSGKSSTVVRSENFNILTWGLLSLYGFRASAEQEMLKFESNLVTCRKLEVAAVEKSRAGSRAYELRSYSIDGETECWRLTVTFDNERNCSMSYTPFSRNAGDSN